MTTFSRCNMAKSKNNIVAFPNARFVIRYRACAMFGNLAGLARFAGISRQALDNRIRSAERWPLTHHWFGFVLALPEPLWCYDAPAVAALPLPDDADIESRRALQTEVWQTAYFKRHAWSSFAAWSPTKTAGAWSSIASGGLAAFEAAIGITNDDTGSK
jgi:hypothetical protein